MIRTLQTTIGEGRAIVSVVYTVSTDTALCYDSASNTESEEQICSITLNMVLMQGLDIMSALVQEQLEELEAECEEDAEVTA